MAEHETDTEHTATATIDNGRHGTRTIRLETGRLARQAAGSVVAYLDDETMVLSATTASKRPKEHLDFFPLTVDVEERMYAAGRIPGSFFRREGRPGTDAILTCRLIDRPLRPSFAKGLRNEVQVVVTVMALDPTDLYDVLAINAAGASTLMAGLPFSGPVAATRVALLGDEWVAFPTVEQLEQATFDMVVAGRTLEDGDVAIMMVEAEATDDVVALVARRRHRARRARGRRGHGGRQGPDPGAGRGAASARRRRRDRDRRLRGRRRLPALPRLPGRPARQGPRRRRRPGRRGADASGTSRSAAPRWTRSRPRSRARCPTRTAPRARSPRPSARCRRS